ncbi:MAG: Ldh family oxidoreductase, partial [Spirochaetes bacterium]|nr:Ldh family oxidoreductase [Spirochaetota bacterium]
DYGIFGDKTAIKAGMTKFLQELRDSKKAEGQTRIYTHGEKSSQLMAERKNGSIPVNEKTLEEMKNIAKSLKMPEQFII